MKKILSTLAVVAVAGAAFAQGTVNFANSAGTPVQFATTIGGAPTSVPAAGGFVQLLWAPSGTALPNPWNPNSSPNLTAFLAANPGWNMVPNSIKPTISAGRFVGGTLTVPTATPGAVVDAILIGWTGASASFDAAYALAAATPATAQVGMTGKFSLDTANPLASPVPETATALTTGLTTPTLLTPVAQVPEPSTFALAGLGAAALLIFRRRK